MATATYAVETGGSSLAQLGRKIQAGVYRAAQFGVEEWQWLSDLEKYDAPISLREITHELDIIQATGASFIPEGGKEARPSSPSAVTATVTPVLLNKRFTVSRTIQLILQKQGTRGMLESQFKWQGRKAVESIRAKLGENFYGFSTGTVALVASVASAPTYDLKALYGIAGLGSVASGHNRRVVDQFVADSATQNADYLAFLNPSGPALRDVPRKVTAKSRTAGTDGGQITTDVAVASAAINDLVVYANNLENTTLAGGTERNLNLVGLLDGATSTSIHGVSGSTYPLWNAALNDATGGRFTGIKLMKGKDAIQNFGGGKADLVIWAQGVKNDVVAQLQAGLRFSDAYGMELDGAPKSKGLEFATSRRTPDGYVFMLDRSNSVRRLMLTPDVSVPGAEEGEKLQDDSGTIFSADFLLALAWTNRSNLAVFSALSQQ
jgi:hypothetical protein